MTIGNLVRIVYRRFLLLRDIKQYGFMPTFKRVAQLREVWAEKGNKILVGEDEYGNKYWTTTDSTEVHRNRWVELKGKSSNWMYDPTEIPSEWHGWLHYSRDEPPTALDSSGKTSVTPQHLKVKHRIGLSGTRDQYFPPHHIFNPVHTNPDTNAYIGYKRPSHQDVLKENKRHFARDYNQVPLEELNEERPRYL